MGKSQIKSQCQSNDNSSRLNSLCVKCHQCTSGVTVNVCAKIRDGTITKINSLTQLAQITESCDLFKSIYQIT